VTTPIVIQGIGALGRLFAGVALGDPRIRLLGVVDIDPAKAGRSVGEVTGDPAGDKVPVVADLGELLRRVPEPPAVLVHMTESRPDRITGPIIEATRHGLNVVSAAESMFYPQLRYPGQAAQIDAAARENGVTVTGTGINPGFVFDQLVLDVAAATTGIRHIALRRTVEVSDTGPGDVEHVGFGLPAAEFRRRAANGTIEGHMGLPESFVLLAEYLDLPIDRVTESWEPVTDARPVPSAIGEIPPGHVVGIVQHATAYLGEREVMTARLAMYYAAREAQADEIVIDAVHPLRVRTEPSAVSLLGAANVLANAVPAVSQAAPGLACVLDLPVARLRRGGQRIVHRAADSVPGEIRLGDGEPS
jgi:4-hydroxy-tetrahydrodipicolinate reductase